MDPVALTIGLSWTLGGLLLIALAIPLARGRVRRNALYGVRLPQSFRSDAAWLAINRFGGRRLAAWAVPMIAVGVAALFLPLRARPGLALIVGLSPLTFLLIAVVQIWRFARAVGRRDAATP